MTRFILRFKFQNIGQYIALFVITCLLTACTEKVRTSSGEFPSIKITNSSGDDFSYTLDSVLHYFSPYPFNVGSFIQDDQQQEVMLISKRIEKGIDVDFIPVARLSLSEQSGVMKNVLIAIPNDDQLKIIDSRDFYDFTVAQFSFKQIVEYWYSNRYGLQGTSIKGWSPADIDDLNVQ